jgi:hypothetical protein
METGMWGEKSEARNPKSETNSNTEIPMTETGGDWVVLGEQQLRYVGTERRTEV